MKKSPSEKIQWFELFRFYVHKIFSFFFQFGFSIDKAKNSGIADYLVNKN